MKWGAISTIARDIGAWVIGAFILVNEERTGHVHIELVITALALIAFPPAIAFTKLVKPDRSKPEIPATPEPSSTPLPPSSPPSSSTSS